MSPTPDDLRKLDERLQAFTKAHPWLSRLLTVGIAIAIFALAALVGWLIRRLG